MTARPPQQATIRVAVVGHTNTGKTSLLRTLTRDPEFGEVSDRPATTRDVDLGYLTVEGDPIMALHDTPGLEDPMAFLDSLEDAHQRGQDWVETLRVVLNQETGGRFGQEVLALEEVMGADLALYVIDARERVLGKYRDELEILSRCAVPILPVLNFLADPEAKVEEWRAQLARLNLHVAASFDTVVLDLGNERQLYEKIQALVHGHEAALAGLLDQVHLRRDRIRAGAAESIAELLIDAAAHRVVAKTDDEAAKARAQERLEDSLRRRETKCLSTMLSLHSFREGDLIAQSLPVENGHWGMDLFNAEALKQFGVTTTSAAAVGAMTGLAVDVVVGGLTLGAAAATGAAVGAVVGAAREKGRDLVALVSGESELRASDETLALLAHRQVFLQQKLEIRGHAAQMPIDPLAPNDETLSDPHFDLKELFALLRKVQAHGEWSTLNEVSGKNLDPARRKIQRLLSDLIQASF